QVGAVEAGVSILAAPEEAGWQWQAEQSRQRDFRAAANKPTAIGMRAQTGDRRAIKLAGEVNAIKAALGVAAIPVRKDIRRDHITDPAVARQKRLFFSLRHGDSGGKEEDPDEVQ